MGSNMEVTSKTSAGETLLKAMQEQQVNNQFCDVTINVGGQAFHAHRCVLAARSPVFSAMLLNECVESACGVIELKEIENSVFEKVLNFLYSQEIDLDVENVCNILFFADMYQIESLSEKCMAFMMKKLDVDNCLSVLVAAKQCHLPVLIYASIQMMRNYFSNDVITAEFYQLNAEHIDQILDNLDSFYDMETEVFHAVMKWLAHNPERSLYISEMLSKFDLKLIRGDSILTEIINSEFMIHNQPQRSEILTKLAVMCCSGIALSSHPSRPQKTLFFSYNCDSEKMKDGKLTLMEFKFLQSTWFVGLQLDYRKFLSGIIHKQMSNEGELSVLDEVSLRFQLELLHFKDPSKNLKSMRFNFTFSRNQLLRPIPLELPFESFMKLYVQYGHCYFTLKIWGMGA